MGNNKLENFISTSFTKIKEGILRNRYALLFCVIFSVIYVLPLLVNDVCSRDDLERSINGRGWKYEGRHLSTFIMSKLTAGGYITDYFPYSQLFSAFLVALSGYIVTSVLGLEKGAKLKFSALILLINPFFIENLTYRWDAIPMAISILFVIVPFLFIQQKWLFILSSILGICVAMFTYQASAPIYILMAIVIVTNKCMQGEKGLLKLITLFASSFLVGLVIYKLLEPADIDLGDRAIVVPLDKNLLDTLAYNLTVSINFVKLIFSRYFSLLMAFTVLLSVVGYLKFLKSDKGWLFKVSIPFLCLFTMFAIIITILALKNYHSFLGARVLVTFPFFIYFLLILINNLSRKIVPFICILFILYSFAPMTAYANALKSQDELATVISQKIEQKVDIAGKPIIFIGKLEYAPEVVESVDKFPIFNNIVPSYLGDHWSLIYFSKKNGYLHSPRVIGLNKLEDQISKETEIIKNKESIPVVDDTFYYVLRADSSMVIVDFDASESKNTRIIVY